MHFDGFRLNIPIEIDDCDVEAAYVQLIVKKINRDIRQYIKSAARNLDSTRGLVRGELLDDPSYVFYKVDLSGLSDIFKFGYDEVLLVVDMQLNRLAPISRALKFITLNFIQYHAKEITSGTYPKIADDFFDCFLEDKKC